MALPLTLTLPSQLSHLPVARAFVEAACQLARLDRADIDAIVLAVNEAISNVIRHAHQHSANLCLQIECRLDSDRIEIVIADEGEPFDLGAVPHLDPGEMRIGGRGIFLMRTLMDELSCEPRTPRGNRLRMVRHCRVRPSG